MIEYSQLQEIVDAIRERISDFVPTDALILGSGLGALADLLSERVVIPYKELPHWPVSAVQGHAGNLVFGYLGETKVVVMQGRAHYYEGWSPSEITAPVRVFKLLGVKRLLVTNSAGGANRSFVPGDLMVITDHINLTGFNPLRGKNDERFGPRFPDMSHAYDPSLVKVLDASAESIQLKLQHGVYVGFTGPTYETPAEVRMATILGGDAVGMSTVPEVIVANHCGLQVAGISCITNLAAGLSDKKLSHDEVKETADLVREQFITLVKTYIQRVSE